MVKATIVIREKDKHTDALAVLDIISFEVSKDQKSINKKLTEILTPHFVDVYNSHSNIFDIHIEFER